MAKKKKRKFRIFRFFIFIILLGASGAMIFLGLNYNKYFGVKRKKFYPDIPKPVVTESKISLVMVGDALIHQPIYVEANKGSGYDFKPIFTEVKDIFKKYDLAYYNQETILGGAELGLSTYPQFNSPYEVGDAFIDMGFNLVSLATNHTLDRGYNTNYKTIANSRAYWDKQTNVIAAGSYTSFEDRDKVIVKEVNGVKYGFLSYSTLDNGIPRPVGKEYFLNLFDKDLVKKNVEALRDKVDLLIVAMHWGIEYYDGVSAEQKEIAKYLSDLGVDIVIGTHSHVAEPIEFVGKTLVVYSLGNFISSQIGAERLTGLVVDVDITKTTVDGKVYMETHEPNADLVYTCKPAVCGSYKVYPYNKLTSKILPNKDYYYKKIMATARKLDPKIGTIFTKE